MKIMQVASNRRRKLACWMSADVVQEQVDLNVAELFVADDDRHQEVVRAHGRAYHLLAPRDALSPFSSFFISRLLPTFAGSEELMISPSLLMMLISLIPLFRASCRYSFRRDDSVSLPEVEILHAQLDRLGNPGGALLDLLHQIVLAELVHDE